MLQKAAHSIVYRENLAAGKLHSRFAVRHINICILVFHITVIFLNHMQVMGYCLLVYCQMLLPAAWNQLLDMAEQFINGNYSAIAYSFRNKGEYEVHLLPPL